MLFFLATGLVEAVWGLWQLYGFEHSQHALFKLTGSFFNPGPYACYLAVIMPAAFGYLLQDWGFYHRQAELSVRTDSSFRKEIFHCFPFDSAHQWNIKQFGPLYVPRKGGEVEDMSVVSE